MARKVTAAEAIASDTPVAPLASISGLPDYDVPIGELIANRKRAFSRVARAHRARKAIPVSVSVPGPIGIHWFGDPHLDDDGCDWRRLEADVELVRSTPGMLAASIGDQHNNWPGRLGRLYGAQETTAAQAWRLVEWFVGSLDGRWLAIVGGNHDLYSGPGDPQQWLAKQARTIYKPWVCRMRLQFPAGNPVTIQARHQWRGHSMWNHAHGIMRAGQRGHMDDVLIGGHIHVSGYGVVVAPWTGKITHCVQVASYKVVDDYADEISADPAHVSSSATIIIDPEEREPRRRVHVVHDPDEGAEYLTWKRARRGYK